MPVSTPNRVADPVILERFNSPGLIRQTGSIFLNYYNSLTTSFLPGEPIVVGGAICLAAEVILPQQQGTVYLDWLADFIVNAALAAAIMQNEEVWWSYDVSPITGFNGGVVNAAPTNGFILGRAIVQPGPVALVSTKAVACPVGGTRIRVVSNRILAVTIGTIPLFN